jgi:hypothetical protein
MALKTKEKEIVMQALDELPDAKITEALDFIGYLQWRYQEDVEDQSWFWTDEWQTRYREAKEDLRQGRFKDFENVEDLLRDLKS